jgi:hypothetical protein
LEADYTAYNGELLIFKYSSTTTKWHYLGFPKVLSNIALSGMFNWIRLTHPHIFGSGVTQGTDKTLTTFGHATFSNSTDKATNYVEYYFTVPDDLDAAVDLTAVLTFQLEGADTGDHEYELSVVSIDGSEQIDSALGDAVSLGYTADASGADEDIEQTAETTLTGWKSALVAGELVRLRLARDGDHANDTSTVNSSDVELKIKYGWKQ